MSLGEFNLQERERENSNSKTLILKDSSVGSIWTYLTASPYYTTNKERERNKSTLCAYFSAHAPPHEHSSTSNKKSTKTSGENADPSGIF